MPSTKNTQIHYRDVVNHVIGLRKPHTNVQKFLSGADPWLIARALELGNESTIIVTNEVRVRNNSKKIKIPDICDDLEVQTCNVFDLLSNTNAVF